MMKKKTALLAAGAAGAYIGLSFLAEHEIFEKNAKIPTMFSELSKKKHGTGNNDPRVDWMHAQQFKQYSITNNRGEKLSGFYLPADEPSDKFVLCSHGYRSRGKGEFRFISKFYHDSGFNIFLVDHTASGDSEGERITFGYYESQDLRLWIDFLLKEFGENIKISLQGISMGSASILLLCGQNELPSNVKFAVSDCSFTTIREQFTSVLNEYHIPLNPIISTVDKISKSKCGFSIDEISPIKAVPDIKIPMLFVHGKSDGFVPVKMVYELYNACTSEKDLLISIKARHGKSYSKDSEAYEKKVLEFTEKYMCD